LTAFNAIIIFSAVDKVDKSCIVWQQPRATTAGDKCWRQVLAMAMEPELL
jgi:hypothetical protein